MRESRLPVSHDSQAVDDSFPLWIEGRSRVERRGSNKPLWLTPTPALRRPPHFSTRFYPLSLILASTSPIRRQLLGQAGVEVLVLAPHIDEEAVKQAHDGDAPSLALHLAKAKALSLDRPADLVIGSDSTLTVGGQIFSKPRDRADAARHLRIFSGKEMILSSAAALARDGVIEWSHVESATLKVRTLSPSFIDSYLEAEWPDVAYCVGVFRMEGRGAALFDAVDGSHFTILGLPLLPLLAALRERGEVPA
jgi:septum formation protein